MDFDRIFNPSIQEQIEDLEYFIERMRFNYNNGSVFCKYRLHKTGGCNLFGEEHQIPCEHRCLLYIPDSELFETMMKLHMDKLRKLYEKKEKS